MVAVSAEQAEDFGGLVIGGSEPVRDAGVELRDFAVSASSAARTLSPASSSRFSAATAATTCVESVRCFRRP